MASGSENPPCGHGRTRRAAGQPTIVGLWITQLDAAAAGVDVLLDELDDESDDPEEDLVEESDEVDDDAAVLPLDPLDPLDDSRLSVR